MKALTIIFFSLIILNFNSKQDLENDKYLNYLSAAKNVGSTYSFNLVINYKNLNTGVIREICIEGDQLIYAICDENNLNFPENSDKIDSIVVSKKDRYFEFQDTAAIKRLSFQEYSVSEFEAIKKKIDFKKIAQEIITQKKIYPKNYPNAHQIYAHALFNLGILTGQNDCMGGMQLNYVDRNNPY